MAGASITLRTQAVAVVASESSVVRMFDRGEIVAEILPELWLLRRYGADLGLPGFLGGSARREQTDDGTLVVSRPSPDASRVPVQERRTLALPVTDRDHRLGPDDAAVTVVLYGDLECPYCARAHDFLTTLRDDLGDDLRLVYRHYPLVRVHPHAHLAAEAAEAADAQDRFWPYLDRLVPHHDALDRNRIEREADALGLDMARFREHLDTHAFADRVHADYRSGVQSGVDATPALFINGDRYAGRLRLDPLRAAVLAARA